MTTRGHAVESTTGQPPWAQSPICFEEPMGYLGQEAGLLIPSTSVRSVAGRSAGATAAAPPPSSPLFPYTTLFRSAGLGTNPERVRGAWGMLATGGCTSHPRYVGSQRNG